MKMKLKTYILFFVLTFSLSSCIDEWFGSGDIVREEFKLDEFNKIRIHSSFEIYLKQGSEHKIEIEAGEDLIPNIDFNVNSDQELSISDENKNNWLRGYDKIKIYLTFEDLILLTLKSTSSVETKDTVHVQELLIFAIGEYADMDLKINSDRTYLVVSESSGGYYKLSGNTYHFDFWARGSAIYNAKEFKCISSKAQSESIGDCYINVSDYLEVEIQNSGNIYYYGNPGTINYLTERAKSQLIKLD